MKSIHPYIWLTLSLFFVAISPSCSGPASPPSKVIAEDMLMELVAEQSEGRILANSIEVKRGKLVRDYDLRGRSYNYYSFDFRMDIEFTENCWWFLGAGSNLGVNQGKFVTGGISKRYAVEIARGYEGVKVSAKDQYKIIGAVNISRIDDQWENHLDESTNGNWRLIETFFASIERIKDTINVLATTEFEIEQLIENGEFDSALEKIRKALNSVSDQNRFFQLRDQALKGLIEYHLAREDWNSLQQLADAYSNVELVASLKRRIEKAQNAEEHERYYHGLLATPGMKPITVSSGHFRAFEAWSSRAELHEELGLLSASVAAYEKAIELAANKDRRFVNENAAIGLREKLSWILASSSDSGIRNPKRAIEHAAVLCSASHNHNGEHLLTLAVAQAAAGEFNVALETLAKSMILHRPQHVSEKSRNDGFEIPQRYMELIAIRQLFEENEPYVEGSKSYAEKLDSIRSIVYGTETFDANLIHGSWRDSNSVYSFDSSKNYIGVLNSSSNLDEGVWAYKSNHIAIRPIVDGSESDYFRTDRFFYVDNSNSVVLSNNEISLKTRIRLLLPDFSQNDLLGVWKWTDRDYGELRFNPDGFGQTKNFHSRNEDDVVAWRLVGDVLLLIKNPKPGGREVHRILSFENSPNLQPRLHLRRSSTSPTNIFVKSEVAPENGARSEMKD